MAIKVKICGIRTVEAAHEAVTAGADLLGFNFVPASRRYITPEEAKDIVEQLTMNVKIVGVFRDESLEKILRIVDLLKLDFVQLHGKEPAGKSELTQYAGVIKVIQSIPGKSPEELLEEMKTYDVDYYLLDRAIQGEGEMASLRLASFLAKHVRLFLAGGLTPENVAYAVRQSQPFGVDVAGGVETDGEQDLEKIRKFIRNAKII